MRNNIFFFLFLIFFISCTPETVTGNDDESEQTNDNSADEDNVNDETDQTTGTTDDESEDNRDYKLAWQDLFDSEELDESVWNIEVNGNGGGNNELQYYSGNNVSIGTEPETGKHCLILTAKKESYQGKSATSGRINSKGKKYFKYGRIEASIKLPKTANGLWPAFWMMGNDYDQVGWPKCGEIDIMEMGHSNGIQNQKQEFYFNGACHWGYYKNGTYPNYSKSTTSEYSLQDDFHLYTLEWTEDYIRMYLDIDKYPNVQPYYEMSLVDEGDDWDTGKYFRKEFFLLFNLAVGGNFTGIHNIDGVTALNSGDARMYVDFIKVYQK